MQIISLSHRVPVRRATKMHTARVFIHPDCGRAARLEWGVGGVRPAEVVAKLWCTEVSGRAHTQSCCHCCRVELLSLLYTAATKLRLAKQASRGAPNLFFPRSRARACRQTREIAELFDSFCISEKGGGSDGEANSLTAFLSAAALRLHSLCK